MPPGKSGRTRVALSLCRLYSLSEPRGATLPIKLISLSGVVERPEEAYFQRVSYSGRYALLALRRRRIDSRPASPAYVSPGGHLSTARVPLRPSASFLRASTTSYADPTPIRRLRSAPAFPAVFFRCISSASRLPIRMAGKRRFSVFSCVCLRHSCALSF